MAGWTNKGKMRLLETLRGVSLPTNFYVMLFTGASAPTSDSNVASDLTEVAAGNGYVTGGYSLTKNTTDFDTISEDDSGNFGSLKIKDVVWTASGGSIPASGGDARYACLVDDDGTVADREIWIYWDLTSDRSVSSGQAITLDDCEIKISES